MAQLQLVLISLPSFLGLLLLSFVCYGHPPLVAACFAPDRLALRKLASDFLQNSARLGFTKLAFEGWQGDECCSWPGVVCKSASSGDPDARVSKLLLSHHNLGGTIPVALCSLSALSTLDLSSNFLSSSIPPCLGQNLTSLLHLDLSYNALNGTIPIFTSQIRHLDMSHNALNGAIPIFCTICTRNLEYLDHSSNSLTSSIPPCLGQNLTSLRHLDLSNNRLNGTIPIFTIGTPNLEYLDLSVNLFTSGTSNLSISALPKLQYLDLSFCPLLSDREIPVTAVISHFPQLRTLRVDVTRLALRGSQIVELLCGLKSLEVLEAGGDFLSDVGDLVSGEMPVDLPSTCRSPSLNLTYLDLSYGQLSGPFPAWMSLFSNLQVLDLSYNNFSSSAIPPEWQNLTRLTHLGLSGSSTSSLHHPDIPNPNYVLPQRNMLSWLFRLPLQNLVLNSLGLTNQHIPCSQLSLLNATLQTLDLSHNLLTDGHACQCLAYNNFTALRSLDLSDNALAFNLGHANILPSLSWQLRLSSCQLEGELTDQFFEMLSSMSFNVDLANNKLSGTLPVGIGVLSALFALDLSHNNFTGPLPTSLGNLTSLWFLHLEYNYLEGEIPHELGYMSSLKFVYLGNNQLTNCLFTHTQSSGLEIIDMSYNRLEGDVMSTFFGHDGSLLQSLTVLLLGHNRLTGVLPASWNGTTAHFLSVIDLSNNRLTGTIPDTLSKLFPSLLRVATVSKSLLGGSYLLLGELTNKWSEYTLVVKNLQLTYHITDGIGVCLDLSNNRFNGSIPGSLGALSGLRYLNLSRNYLTGSIPSDLANLSVLESLDLAHNRLQGPIPATFSQLTKLATFNVSFNAELTGSIPINSPQFEDNTSYIGDPRLCGEPVLQRCLRRPSVSPQLPLEESSSSWESELWKWVDEWIAIPGFCVACVVGFAGVLWILKITRFV